MFAFIDESGDCGLKLDRGSSPFFTVAVVVFSDVFSADACDRGIDELRRKLSIPGKQEFHFNECRDSLRQKFLKHVVNENFRYYAFILNKQKLWAEKYRDPDEVYQMAAKFVCDNARQYFENTKVVIDKTGDREFKRRLEKTLKATMTDQDGTCRIRKVSMEHSHLNNLVQLADMVCGAVARDFNANKTPSARIFRNLIRAREERVQFWPK
jgi:hypothetical protein